VKSVCGEEQVIEGRVRQEALLSLIQTGTEAAGSARCALGTYTCFLAAVKCYVTDLDPNMKANRFTECV